VPRPPNPIICGRKFCATCGRWRLIVDFPCYTREPFRLQGSCRLCTKLYRRKWVAEHAEQVKRTQRKHRELHLEEVRAREREYERKRREDPVTAPIVREQRRQWLARLRADPERWAQLLADRRMDYRLRAEREGRKTREIREQTYANGNGAAPVKARLLPAAPIAELISEWTGAFGGIALGGHDYRTNAVAGAGLMQLAELCGVSERSLGDYVSGRRKTIQYPTADKICTALDTPITALYDTLEEL
jgi:transcriptional regulator with XRE-family HTH domain